jgi:hypothetical protein
MEKHPGSATLVRIPIFAVLSQLDQQYMQQSSQIFVFSTQWANKAAEAVIQGAYSTIICWHENQPETKKHLEVREN